MVRGRMGANLEAETDTELKLALDARARSLCPGIKAQALANLLINVRPSAKHTVAEVNRIALRTLFWSGALSKEDPGPQYERALRRAKSGRFVLEQTTKMITSYYGAQTLPKEFKERMLAYTVVAALRIYEQAGGDPVNTQPEEESWSI